MVHSLFSWLFCKGELYLIWSILTHLYYTVDLNGNYPQERVDNLAYYWVVGTIVNDYMINVVHICQIVISALIKGYHLSRDYLVPIFYSACNKIHHIQCPLKV